MASDIAGSILVVDDDESARRLLTGMLSDAGYDVLGVGSAREARHVLEHDTVALLLTEVSMRGETGLDLMRFAFGEHPRTAMLLMSALEDPGIAQVAMDFGACGYLGKPVSRSAVLVGVTSALRQRDMQEREHATREELERTTSAFVELLERLETAAEQSRVRQSEIVRRWARAAEYHDPAISEHLARMSRYCGVLGHKLDLHAESLELSSVLHDVGKVVIPDHILRKRGLLTTDERLVVEGHAEAGYQMLRDSSSSVLDLAAVIALTHHESFDGSGYPRGLSGTDIPLEGRVAAVADVFDGMTSDREYRRAWSVDATIAWMKRESGKRFDPAVLGAFLSCIDEIMEIRSALQPASESRPDINFR